MIAITGRKYEGKLFPFLASHQRSTYCNQDRGLSVRIWFLYPLNNSVMWFQADQFLHSYLTFSNNSHASHDVIMSHRRFIYTSTSISCTFHSRPIYYTTICEHFVLRARHSIASQDTSHCSNHVPVGRIPRINDSLAMHVVISKSSLIGCVVHSFSSSSLCCCRPSACDDVRVMWMMHHKDGAGSDDHHE